MTKNKLLLAFALCLTASCSSNEDAVDTLTKAGYKDIETTGYSFFGCGSDDRFSTGFVATNPAGQRVKGVVCSGFFKGGTIRF
jgi:hypothetical protein